MTTTPPNALAPIPGAKPYDEARLDLLLVQVGLVIKEGRIPLEHAESVLLSTLFWAFLNSNISEIDQIQVLWALGYTDEAYWLMRQRQGGAEGLGECPVCMQRDLPLMRRAPWMVPAQAPDGCLILLPHETPTEDGEELCRCSGSGCPPRGVFIIGEFGYGRRLPNPRHVMRG